MVLLITFVVYRMQLLLSGAQGERALTAIRNKAIKVVLLVSMSTRILG